MKRKKIYSKSSEKENNNSCCLDSKQKSEQPSNLGNSIGGDSLLSIFSLADGSGYDATLVEELETEKRKKKKKKGPSLYEKMLGMQAEQQGQQGADSNIKKSANLKSTQNIEYSGNSKGGIASKANALNKNKGGK